MRRGDPFSDPEGLIRRIYAYVAYRIGDGPDAEDVTAAAIERALRYRDSYDPAKGDAVGWVIGIARRVMHSRASLPLLADVDETAAAEDDVEERTLRGVSVRAAVARLHERDRELIALRFGADLKASEIARVLEMSTNAVEVALHRALGRLRTQLGDAPPVQARPVAQPLPD